MKRRLRDSCPAILTVVNAGLAILICLVAVFVVKQALTVLVADQPLRPSGAAPSQPQAAGAPKSLEQYEPLVRNNPFGIPAGELIKLSEGKGPVTPAGDLRLLGTLAGPGHLSYAILADKTARQEVFKIGEKVFDAGTLSKVEKERVFIESNGTRIEVPFVELGIAAEPAQKTQAAASSGGFSPQSVISSGAGTYIVDQKAILQAIEKPQQLMTDARLQPNVSSGKQEGFVLREVKPNGIYHALGLKNNDILLRINNFDIAGPETALQAFTALRGMDRVALDVVRGGARMTLTYQIR